MIYFSFSRRLETFQLNADASFGNERVVVTGENGAGKTTLLRLIAGLEAPDQGYLKFFGQTWFDSSQKLTVPAHCRKAAYVFSNAALLPWLSVADNMLIGLSSNERKNISAAIQKTICALKLEPLMIKRSCQLSAGETQRVTLARALLSRPRMLLLDEPFSAQSPKMRDYLQQWLVQLHERLQFPMIMVTHNNDEAKAVGQRHWHMSNGGLINPFPTRVTHTTGALYE